MVIDRSNREGPAGELQQRAWKPGPTVLSRRADSPFSSQGQRRLPQEGSHSFEEQRQDTSHSLAFTTCSISAITKTEQMEWDCS